MSSMLLNILTVFLIFLLSACSSFISPTVAFLFVLYFVASTNTTEVSLSSFEHCSNSYFVICASSAYFHVWGSIGSSSITISLVSCVFFLLSLLFSSCTSYYLWPVLISTLITICRNSLSKTKIHFFTSVMGLSKDQPEPSVDVTGSTQPRWIRLTCLQCCFIPSQS